MKISCNPNEFWKKLNLYRNRKENIPESITMDQWVHHFRNLGQTSETVPDPLPNHSPYHPVLMQALGNCGVWLENYFMPGLMFADDIVLFSEDKEALQTAMDRLHTYCSEWKLRVNKNKAKVVAFSNSPKKELELRYNGSTRSKWILLNTLV